MLILEGSDAVVVVPRVDLGRVHGIVSGDHRRYPVPPEGFVRR
jgi:hypothetical protein